MLKQPLGQEQSIFFRVNFTRPASLRTSA